MRAAILTGPGKVEIQEVPEPTAIAGSLVVAIDYCGVGGSDHQSWKTGWLPSAAWFGHEWAGRVVEVGPGVTGHFPGERIIGAVSPPCGVCRHCVAGLGQWCSASLEMILGTDPLASPHGAFAERIRIDARRAARVPEAVDDVDAALAEPASVAAHAIVRSQMALGDLVVVVGVGTIGGLIVQLAKHNGATRIVAVDQDRERRELACDLGATAAFDPGSEVESWLANVGHGLGADVAFACSPRPEALTAAVESCRLGGTVVAIGGSGQGGSLASLSMIQREVTLQASRGYNVADVHRALEFMASDLLRVSGLIQPEILGLDDLGPHLESGRRSSGGPPKFLVSPSR